MHKYISHNRELLIISDTSMCFYNKSYYAFGPVVRELPVLLDLFDSITWVGFEDNSSSGKKLMIEIPSRVKLIFLRKCGGNRFIDKIVVATFLPKMFFVILSLTFKNKYIHTRGPSTPALIAILLSIFLRNKNFWHKYAVNWINVNPPFLYSIQRKLLVLLKHTKVTVNGSWSNLPKHCLSFENPCIDKEQWNFGGQLKKDYSKELCFVFIGRIDEAKGIDLLIKILPNINYDRIIEWFFMGEGPLRKDLELKFKKLGIKATFLGFSSQNKVHEILARAHVLVLPSKSEGFPKVVAEAWNYSTIPIVTNVGGIPFYLKDQENGFLVADLSEKALLYSVQKLMNCPVDKLEQMAQKGRKVAEKFTFENYKMKLQQEVFS